MDTCYKWSLHWFFSAWYKEPYIVGSLRVLIKEKLNREKNTSFTSSFCITEADCRGAKIKNSIYGNFFNLIKLNKTAGTSCHRES